MPSPSALLLCFSAPHPISNSQISLVQHKRRMLLASSAPRIGFSGQVGVRIKGEDSWSFLAGSGIAVLRPAEISRRGGTGGGGGGGGAARFRTSASWMTTSQIASYAFTVGTVAVLPFYTLMVVAPNAEVTKRTVESSAPYVILGVLYAYLLYLSWTPETLRSMFASKYWLPELPGIARMFMNEMTVASAWIHLLAVDLFAARQVYHDGIKNKIETRHSVSLCLLFCPIGIVTHVITKRDIPLGVWIWSFGSHVCPIKNWNSSWCRDKNQACLRS